MATENFIRCITEYDHCPQHAHAYVAIERQTLKNLKKSTNAKAACRLAGLLRRGPQSAPSRVLRLGQVSITPSSFFDGFFNSVRPRPLWSIEWRHVQ